MALVSESRYQTGQYVGGAVTGGPNLRASYTICVRALHQNLNTALDTSLVQYAESGALSNRFGFGRQAGASASQLRGIRKTGASDFFVSASGYEDATTWRHFACVYDHTTETASLWIDGVQTASTSSPFDRLNDTTSTILMVGWHPAKYADLVLYDRALSGTEIGDLVPYRVPQVSSGLLGYWRLESDGTDSSGNGNTLTVLGSSPNVSWDSAVPPQPEAPAGEPVLAGDLATVSALVGAIDVSGGSVALAGDSLTTSALSGSLVVAVSLASDVTTVSTLDASLGVALPLSGDSATTSSLTGALDVALALSADAATVSALDGALVVAHPLAGDAATVSILVGALDVAGGSVALTGDATTVTSLAGSLALALELGADAATTSALDGSLTQSVGLAGSSVTTTALAASLALSTGLAADAVTVSALDGTLTQSLALAGDSATASVFTAALSQAQPLAADSSTLSALSAALSVVAGDELVGAATTTSELTGSLTLALALASDAATTTALAGDLALDLALEGGATTASQLLGALGLATGLAADAATTSSLGGTLDVALTLAGGASTTSALGGTLAQAQALAGAALTTSALGGALAQSQPLAGAALTASSLAAALGVTSGLAGDATTTSSLAAALAVSRLVGSLDTVSALAAALRPLWGATFFGGIGSSLFRNALPIDQSAQTFMLWMRFSDGDLASYGRMYQGPAADTQLLIQRDGVGYIAYWKIGGTYVHSTYLATDVNGWHHYALTYDGATWRAYLDGVEVANGAVVLSGALGGQLVLNAAGGTNTIEMAQAKVWSTALGATAVASEMLGHTPHWQTSSLQGWYQLAWVDETLDESGNGYHFSGVVDEGTTQAPGTLVSEIVQAAAVGVNVTHGYALGFARDTVPRLRRRRRWPVRLE